MCKQKNETEQLLGKQQGPLFCPSAQPGLGGSMILGVVERQAEGQRVSYLNQPANLTEGTIATFAGAAIQPTELFRFTAPCMHGNCSNWTGNNCRVAERLVQILPAVTVKLPKCTLRPRCRWFSEQGVAACMRCPQVRTDDKELEAALNRDPAEIPLRPASSFHE
jgi:hypothetical protein